MSAIDLPIPVANADSAPYWQAARAGKPILQRCQACGTPRFYPRHLCPHCWSDQAEWIGASGRGTIHAATIVRRAPAPAFRDRVPYAIALIDLEEGPRLLTNLVGPGAESAGIGQAVEVTFETRGDSALPQFRIAGAEPA